MARILGIPKQTSQGIPNNKYIRLAYMKTWNERLRFARQSFGCKPTDLARETGVSNATVSDWESGEIKNLSAESLLKVCEFLQISPTWLQFGRGEMHQTALTEADCKALEINRKLSIKERSAWYRVGDSLAEPTDGTNGTQ